MKCCKICNVQKDESDFYNQKNYKDGLDPMCKCCRNENSKKYNDINRERLADYRRKYNQKNKERIKKRMAEYYIKNKNKNNG